MCNGFSVVCSAELQLDQELEERTIERESRGSLK